VYLVACTLDSRVLLLSSKYSNVHYVALERIVVYQVEQVLHVDLLLSTCRALERVVLLASTGTRVPYLGTSSTCT